MPDPALDLDVVRQDLLALAARHGWNDVARICAISDRPVVAVVHAGPGDPLAAELADAVTCTVTSTELKRAVDEPAVLAGADLVIVSLRSGQPVPAAVADVGGTARTLALPVHVVVTLTPGSTEEAIVLDASNAAHVLRADGELRVVVRASGPTSAPFTERVRTDREFLRTVIATGPDEAERTARLHARLVVAASVAEQAATEGGTTSSTRAAGEFDATDAVLRVVSGQRAPLLQSIEDELEALRIDGDRPIDVEALRRRVDSTQDAVIAQLRAVSGEPVVDGLAATLVHRRLTPPDPLAAARPGPVTERGTRSAADTTDSGWRSTAVPPLLAASGAVLGGLIGGPYALFGAAIGAAGALAAGNAVSRTVERTAQQHADEANHRAALAASTATRSAGASCTHALERHRDAVSTAFNDATLALTARLRTQATAVGSRPETAELAAIAQKLADDAPRHVPPPLT